MSVADKHPDQKAKIVEIERHMAAITKEMETSLHKAAVVSDEMYKNKPDEQIMGQALDRAIVIARRLETDAAKWNAALDEVLAACGLVP